MSSETLVSLDYTWADVTFSGGGFGVVQTSAGWDRLHEKVSGFENWLSSVGVKTLTIDGVKAMVAFIPNKGGRSFVVMKRELAHDSAGRGGRYIVRVIVDPTRTLTLATAMDLALSHLPTLDWPVDKKPEPKGPRPVCGNVHRAPAEPKVLAAIMEAFEAGTTVKILGPNPCAMVASAVEYLPPDIASKLSLSSHHAAGIPPTVIVADRDVLRLENTADELWPVTLEAETQARDYLNFAMEVGVPDLADLNAWREWIVGQRRRRQALEDLTLVECGFELADPHLPLTRRFPLVERIRRAEVDGDISPQERSNIRGAMGHEAAMEIVTALCDYPLEALRIPDVEAALAVWGATPAEIRELLFARWRTLVFDPFDVRDVEKPTLLGCLDEFLEVHPRHVADVAELAWVRPHLLSTWSGSSQRVFRRYWLEGAEPEASLAQIGWELLCSFEEECRAELPDPNDDDVQLRLERALRAQPEGRLWEAIERLRPRPVAVETPSADPGPAPETRRWLRRVGRAVS